MKLAILAGTRPDIIKLSPIIKECENLSIPYVLIYSNQHYSTSLSTIFFEELSIPKPHHIIDSRGSKSSTYVSDLKNDIKDILKDKSFDYVLVHGDTDTALAGAMSAYEMDLKIAHIEAGLRSFDLNMVEEKNRMIIGHFSDLHFAVTGIQTKNLKDEGISSEKIFEVGNTIYDAVLDYIDLARSTSTIKINLEVEDGEYYLFTSHRGFNVDNKTDLEETINLIGAIPGKVCWPIHPRTSRRIKDYNLELADNIVAMEPLGYLDFLKLLEGAKSVITDSGGVQEEAYILKTPCVTMRESTERPETLYSEANVLVGRDIGKLHENLDRSIKSWSSPFGEGDTAKKIIEILSSCIRSA
ncbi:MAG: UDP-N-acetylglucosamine 2-epimerase (non-hydrolyzing) [Bacteriovoracaceae bacterium]|jgi:UDP-N-acetylglucosamine 2-epimerase (non-hydrolysing)